MSAHTPQWWRALSTVLIDPVSAHGMAISRPEPWRLFGFFVAVLTVLVFLFVYLVPATDLGVIGNGNVVSFLRFLLQVLLSLEVALG